METKASYITVGAFVLILIAGVLASILWLAGVDVEDEPTRYDILFDGSVTGLQIGGTVRYRGVPVGTVETIDINPDNVEQVVVTIDVPEDVPIKTDTVASLEFQGITGVAYVQLDGGTNEAAMLEPEPGRERAVIPSRPSGIQQVIEQAPELVTRFVALVDRANAMLGAENQANVARSLENIASMTEALDRGSDDAERLLAEGADALGELRATIADARGLIADLSDASRRLTLATETTLAEGSALMRDIRPLVDTADTAMAEATLTFGEARAALATLDETLLRTQGALGEGERTLRSFGALADELTPRVGPLAEDAGATLREFAVVAEDLRAAARNIATAADEVAVLLGSNQAAVQEFASIGLVEFTQLVSETRTLVSTLTRVSTELERDPARFLFGDQQQGFEVR